MTITNLQIRDLMENWTLILRTTSSPEESGHRTRMQIADALELLVHDLDDQIRTEPIFAVEPTDLATLSAWIKETADDQAWYPDIRDRVIALVTQFVL